MSFQDTGRTAAGMFALVVVLMLAGCTLQWVPEEEEDTPDVPATTITIKAVNKTDKPLDPQLYVGAVADGVAGLFVTDNKRTDFGLGGVGIIVGGADASFEVDCDTDALIGTQGGIYGDDLTAPDGTGEQKVLQEDLNITCGDLVTFTFSAGDDGLNVTLSIEPRNG